MGIVLTGFVGIKLMLVDGIVQAIYASQAMPINIDGLVWGIIRTGFKENSVIIKVKECL